MVNRRIALHDYPAHEDDELGFVVLLDAFHRLSGPVLRPRPLELRQIEVAEPHRRQGLGRILVGMARGYASARDYDFLFGWYPGSATGIRRFYAQCGFSFPDPDLEKPQRWPWMFLLHVSQRPVSDTILDDLQQWASQRPDGE